MGVRHTRRILTSKSSGTFILPVPVGGPYPRFPLRKVSVPGGLNHVLAYPLRTIPRSPGKNKPPRCAMRVEPARAGPGHTVEADLMGGSHSNRCRGTLRGRLDTSYAGCGGKRPPQKVPGASILPIPDREGQRTAKPSQEVVHVKNFPHSYSPVARRGERSFGSAR